MAFPFPDSLPVRRHARPAPMALAVLMTLPGWALAQTVSNGGLEIDPRLVLAPTLLAQAAPSPESAVGPLPRQKLAMPAPPAKGGAEERVTYVEARSITGLQDVDLEAKDDVHLVRGDITVDSDKLHYDQLGNVVTADGNVRVVRGYDKIVGPHATLNLDTWFGEFQSPNYSLRRERWLTGELPARGAVRMMDAVTATGEADVLKFEGENHYRLTNATYTSCPAPSPDWYLRVRDLSLDYDRDQGTGKDTTLIFKGVPILYTPWAEFPLSGGRQSGLLPPTYGGMTSTGIDITLPYYFNLAPNYDATLSPRLTGRRGFLLGGEARYLLPAGNGILRGEWMPEDGVSGESRGALSFKHTQTFSNGVSATVDLNDVSDREYFADLSSKIAATSTATLNRQLTVGFGYGGWLTTSTNIQSFKTIIGGAPYDRLPQITAQATFPDVKGFAFTVPAELTRFDHPTQDLATRTMIYPQVAWPLQQSAFFVTPKLGMHLTHYSLDRRTTTGPTDISRAVPVLSVDSGLNFERDTTWGGKDQIQTLEPRLYYVRAGYRNQTQIPVFDSGRADFNFAQIFSENVYAGQDRIADSNQITAAVQSRLIESDTGEEWLRGALGQRLYFSDQRVTLPGEAQRTGRIANLLALLSGKLSRELWLDSALEYDKRESEVQRGSFGVRYQPGYGRVASASFRYQNGVLRDLDLSTQWPIWQRWYGVARYNRNLRDHKLTEAIAGLEYKGDCWVFRGVWQTLLNTKQVRNNGIFLQLEFNGLASLGTNPVSLLKRSVGGYGKINGPGSGDPVFGVDADD